MAAEHDENVVRKAFTPSEAVAIAEAIRERVEGEARRRPGGRPSKKTGGNLPPVSDAGKSRDTLAKRVGLSGRTYEKARAVVEAARAEPDKFGDFVERLSGVVAQCRCRLRMRPLWPAIEHLHRDPIQRPRQEHVAQGRVADANDAPGEQVTGDGGDLSDRLPATVERMLADRCFDPFEQRRLMLSFGLHSQ